MSRFQLILLIVFGAFIVVAVLIFSLSRGGSSAGTTLAVWGSIPNHDFARLMTEGKVGEKQGYAFKYTEVREDMMESQFTEALAVNQAPDLIILPHDSIWKNRNKIFTIPYQNISVQTYKNTFIEAGDLMLSDAGINALPLYVDPLVLYWNRDLFSKAALVRPIAYWDEIYAASQKLTEKDGAGNILVSTMALGETRNIPHYKEILSLLMLQAGTPIILPQAQGLKSFVADSMGLPVTPGSAAVDFYTQFSNPAKPYYSWNRSMLPAQTNFISGGSAMYLGFASELSEIKAKNPNLNFGLALVPQSRVSGKALTYGKLYSVAISKGTRNVESALGGALILVGRESSALFSLVTLLPPARRDLLENRPQDESLALFYDAAIQSRAWTDPDRDKTKTLFSALIDSVTSGRSRTSEALFKADNDLRVIIESTK
ncbi:MAG: ABC transporter substrate-binding protein [Parcubacteria group bacterium]